MHRLPSEVNASSEEWITLAAWDTVYNEMQNNICPECLERIRNEIHICFHCGQEYTEEEKYSQHKPLGGGAKLVKPDQMKEMFQSPPRLKSEGLSRKEQGQLAD